MNELTQLNFFLAFAKDKYPDCTLEQKLSAYLQHHPIRALPFLLELLTEFEDMLSVRNYLFPPKPVEEPDARAD